MHRFYLPPSESQTSELILPESESHHGVKVLRLRLGERVVALDGCGGEMSCDVLALEPRLKLRVLHRNTIPPLPCQVTLLQALTRGKTMDLIVQKATELGVSRVIPLLSERIVSQPGEDHGAGKVEKWEATSIEAIKQCGSPWRPKIDAPLTPLACLARGERFELSLVASLRPDAIHPRRQFDLFVENHGRLPRSVAVWVGPEGDFTPAEMNSIQAAGVQPITLGPLVLRSETAAIYCLSVINYELQSTRT